MKYIVPLGTIALALGACGDKEPAGSGASEESPADPFTQSGLDGDMAAGAARDMQWTYREGERTAVYGPAGSEGVLVLRCQDARAGTRELALDWNVDARPGTTETITVGWGNLTDTFGVTAIENVMMPGGYGWGTTFDPGGEIANMLLGAPSPITFQAGASSGAMVTVPADNRMKRVIRDCQDEG